jgi:hypothetical protein
VILLVLTFAPVELIELGREFRVMLGHGPQTTFTLKSRVTRKMEGKVIVAVCRLPELYIYLIHNIINNYVYRYYKGQKLFAPPDYIMNLN